MTHSDIQISQYREQVEDYIAVNSGARSRTIARTGLPSHTYPAKRMVFA